MRLNHFFALQLTLIILFSALVIPPASAVSSVMIGNESVKVRMDLSLSQNATTIPEFSLTLSGENSTSLNQTLTTAIRSHSPAASLKDLKLSAFSDGSAFRLSIEFELIGVLREEGGLLKVDMSWRSFSVDEEVEASGFSINRVGESYLLQTVKEIIQSALNSTPQNRWTFRLNGLSSTPNKVETAVDGLSLLDFAQLEKGLSHWETAFDLTSRVTRLSTQFSFSLDATNVITEPAGEQIRLTSSILYNPSVEIISPGLATILEDVIIVDRGSPDALVASLIILVPLVGLFVSSIAEQKVQGVRRPRRPRK